MLSRWQRSRELGADPFGRGQTRPRLPRVELRDRLARATTLVTPGESLLASAASELQRRGFALLLADDEGVILAARGLDALPAAMRATLAEGARWHEADRGTNGIGTVLAEGIPVAVLGRAHYDQHAHDMVCYAAPVCDASGLPVAVLDISGPCASADPLLGIVVQSLAASLETALRLPPGAASRVHLRAPPRGRLIDRTVALIGTTTTGSFDLLVGDDPDVVEARDRAAQFARTPLPILIMAETGTGKELLARAIHAASAAAGGPFVAVNCGALPAGLLESELFGYAPGAFTGARPGGNEGKIGAAAGGTLFLDEVAEMPPSLQAMLLRVLEDGTYARVGEARELHARFRLVCATCRDLPAMVRQGLFRRDLFFRIHSVHLTLPPLRERSDLPRLANALLTSAALEAGVAPVPALAETTLAAMAHRRWLGNVRELKHALGYALVLAAGAPVIGPEHLPMAVDLEGSATTHPPTPRRQAEAEAARRALDAARGNLTAAAAILGVARSTLYRMIQRHGLLDADGS